MVKGHTAISPMISAPKIISDNWSDIGQTYSCFGFSVIGLYIKLTINNSQDFRVRIIATTSLESETGYVLPINLITSEKTYVTDAYAEIDVKEGDIESDKDILLFFDIDCVVPFFKVQVQGGFVGTIPATVDYMAYCLGDK